MPWMSPLWGERACREPWLIFRVRDGAAVRRLAGGRRFAAGRVRALALAMPARPPSPSG